MTLARIRLRSSRRTRTGPAGPAHAASPRHARPRPTATTDAVEARPTHVDAPLSPVGSRFPLGLGTHAAPVSPEPPSRSSVRPFGMRFTTTVDRTPRAVPPWYFCPDRQIAVVDDGSGDAWYRRLEAAGTGSKDTTGPSPDGQGSTGNEEWTPDFLGDASS